MRLFADCGRCMVTLPAQLVVTAKLCGCDFLLVTCWMVVGLSPTYVCSRLGCILCCSGRHRPVLHSPDSGQNGKQVGACDSYDCNDIVSVLERFVGTASMPCLLRAIHFPSMLELFVRSIAPSRED